MKVYVAGTWDFSKPAKRLIDRLVSLGHFAHDWTDHRSLTNTLEYAMSDEKAVRECDMFVITSPETISRGKFTEFGMALALHKPIVVLGDATQLGIFGHLNRHVIAKSEDDVIKIVESRAI